MATKIIGIAGKAGAGKDAIAKILKSVYGYEIYSFAEPIRRTAKDVLMIDEEFLETNKESNLEWVDTSYRDFAQKFGTEFVRNMIDKDFWIKRAAEYLSMTHPMLLVIPDVRFQNEVDWIRSLGGTIWHVERFGIKEVKHHVSEFGIKLQGEDIVIYNHAGLFELKNTVMAHINNLGD